VASYHDRDKRHKIDRLGAFQVRLRNMTLTITVCANVVLLSPAQSQSAPPITAEDNSSASDSANPATVSGTVLDKDGAAIPNAKVFLTEGSFSIESISGGDGSFTFRDVPAGSFQLSLSAPGFGTQTQ
jgi:hypothetical protein